VTILATPTINGTEAGQAISDQQTIAPFADVAIADTNIGQTETLTVTLSAAANGTLTNLGGGAYNSATGVYTVTGAASAVTAALAGLVFTPTLHQVSVGQAVTTGFTIGDIDTASQSATDSTTTVVATAIAVPPTISGTGASQAITDQTTISPFAQFVIADANIDQTETVTVTLSAAANGTLTNLGGGMYDAAVGVYSVTGPASQVTATLNALVFTPTQQQVEPGLAVTTDFTIDDTDTVSQTASDSTTVVVVVAVAVVPTINGTEAGQQISDQETISPFASVVIADANLGQIDTVTVTMSTAANGTLTNLGEGAYDADAGVYSVTGTALEVTAALNALTFTPTPYQVTFGQAVTTGFAISDADTAAQSATDSTTTIVATATAVPPTINGTGAGQQISDQGKISPLGNVVIVDSNPGQTETVTVTLSAKSDGTLSNLGGGTYHAATGIYTDIGTATAVTTALDGLVFTPTFQQVPSGQTVTTEFTIVDTDTAGASATDTTTSVVVTASAPITPPPAPARVTPAPAGLAIFDTTTGRPSSMTGQAYAGPVSGLTSEFITATADSLNVSISTPGWFIHTGSGNDAVAVSSGTNVLDGSTGSNFLTGGTGNDTFFIDDRGPTFDIWGTCNNFHSGDGATVWGVTPSDFTLSWVNGQGAGGYTGLTLHATAPGKPTASLTLVGYSSADLTNGRLTVSFGATAATGGVPGSSYMHVQAN
jgi:hypothetical protein